MTRKILFGGVWRTVGQTASTGQAPTVPLSVSAVSTASGRVDVSWAAPSSDGTSPITGYIVTAVRASNGATTTKPAAASTRSLSLSGLTIGAAYVVTVQAQNGVGVSPASSGVTVTVAGTSSKVYGPDGTEWAPNTVADGTNFNVIVSSGPALLSAISAVTTAQANAGYRIGVADDTDLAPTSTLVIPQSAALDAATKAILIRPVTPGGAKFTHSVQISCSNLAIAYMDIYANFKWTNGPKNTWQVRCHGIGVATINVSSGKSDTNNPGGSDCGIVGSVYPDDTEAAFDRLHISPHYSGSGHTPGHAMRNFSVIRACLEGMQFPTGTSAHADMVQIDGLVGVYYAANTYFGKAGNNGTTQAKADIFWSADGDFCTIEQTDCLLAGAHIDGQGNSSNQSGPDRRTRCVFFDGGSRAFLFNNPLYTEYQGSTAPDTVLTDCTFYGTISGSGSGLKNVNPTMLAASARTDMDPAIADAKNPPWKWWA